MKIRYGRLGGIAALTAVVALASGPLMAGQEVSLIESNAEDSLLGVHLMKSTFRDVLKKYGQPSEIQAGGPFSPTPPPGAASASQGGGGAPGPMGPGGMGMGMGKGMGMGPSSAGGGGGAPGMGGGGGKKQTSKNGFPGSNGAGGGGGGKMGGPGGAPAPGMMGPGGSGPMMGPGSGGPGAPGMMGPGSGGGLPGFGPSSPGAGGDESGSEGPGTGTDSEDNPPVKEATWWYHDHQNGLHIAFVFNRVGQVIQIGEYGPKKLGKMHGVAVPNAGATRRGLVLGNSLGSVIGRYGFSLDGAHDADNIIMRFGHRDKIAFQMVNNAILGITVGVTR